MSGSKRCCCGKAEGCELCETLFNQPIPPDIEMLLW
jgi:hypothetical protein